MKKLRKMLRQKEFYIFLACFFANLFNWPFLAVPENYGPSGLFIYLLLVWAIMIALLFFISRSFSENIKGERKKGGEADADV
ncbi:MAG TPA: hypothetical protein VEF33_08325 [Syntrophales bacterium]|nr:hypothetical protein [Syntrophales bacterium]